MEASASSARSVGGSLLVPQPPTAPALGGETPPSARLVGGASPPLLAPPARQNEFVLKLPAGFHFRPTDDELVVHFLRRKIAGQPPLLPVFINLLQRRPDHLTYMEHHSPDHLTDMEQQNMEDPEDLVEKYREFGEDRWFFFTKREKKYNVGPRPVRTTPNGSWKATGSVRVIYPAGAGDGEVVGRVRTLVYYANHDDKPTDWTMYEYESVASLEEAQNKNTHKLDEWVLWTIQKKQNCGKNCERKGRKAVKRKEPSPDSGSNEGNTSAEEEEQKDDSSAGAGGKEGGKEKKGKKKKKADINAQEERPNAKQNADLLLMKRSPAPTPPLPQPPHFHPEGNGVVMDPELTFLNDTPFNFDPNYPMQQAMAAPPLDASDLTALAFVQAMTTSPQHLPPRAAAPVPTFILPPGAMLWPPETQPRSHGSSSYYYGAGMMSHNPFVHHPAIRSCSYEGRHPIPSFPHNTQRSYMAAPAPSGAQAQASIGHHASIAHNASVTRYGYADFGFVDGLLGTSHIQEASVAAPAPQFNIGAPAPAP